MPQLTIATTASAAPMGAQVYEREIVARAGTVLGPDWAVRELTVRSLRSPLAGNRRLPMGWLAGASARSRRSAGRVLYRRGEVVHRMGLTLPPAPGPEVITIHDAVAWRFPDEAPPIGSAAEEARRAAAVICVSEFSADEVSEVLGVDRPHVVYNGVDPRYGSAEPLPGDRRRELGIEHRYVLHAGGASARKNLEALAGAWPMIHSAHPDVRLVLSGPPHERRDRLFGRLPGTVLVGRLPDAAMPGLVAGAAVVVVPSLYEGFGLPALEAMAAGVPVVAAETSSLPEVVGGDGTLVPPTAQGVADGVVWALSGDGEIAARVARGRERAAEFTWERSAAGHAEVWRAVVGG